MGGFDPNVDAFAVKINSGTTAVANSAKHKLVGLLNAQLKADGIYVADLVVSATVKGTAWDTGQGTLEGSAVGAKFWEMYKARTDSTGSIS